MNLTTEQWVQLATLVGAGCSILSLLVYALTEIRKLRRELETLKGDDLPHLEDTVLA